MQRSSVAFLALAALLVLSTFSEAAVPRLLSYQGTLTDTTGIPLSGPRDMTFRLYPDSIGAVPVFWQEQHPAVPVEAGLFQLKLGGLVALPESLFDMTALWLGVTVGTDPELSPRQRMTSAFWAVAISSPIWVMVFGVIPFFLL